MDKKTSGNKTWYKLDRNVKEASRVTGAPIHGKGSQKKHVDLTEKQADKYIKFAYLLLSFPFFIMIWAISVLQ